LSQTWRKFFVWSMDINGKFEWGKIDGSDWYYGSSIVLTYTLGQDPRSGWQIMW
jgi:hypothetical protein